MLFALRRAADALAGRLRAGGPDAELQPAQQENWTWPWLPTVANRATVGSQWVRAGGREKWADFGPGTLILIKFRRNPEISSTPYFESNFEKSWDKPMHPQGDNLYGYGSHNTFSGLFQARFGGYEHASSTAF